MGKPTGFLEFDRLEAADRSPAERVRDWEPFHNTLSEEKRAEQGARCMNCGVPYCQSGIQWEGRDFGCPLHNLIPEWNDMIMLENPSHALSRLLKTNNFPEFTGRVCPAPCEKACICGIWGDSVTIRDNELFIIEKAFEDSKIRRNHPPQYSGKRVCVVGSGPAGLAVADQLNHRGHHVTVVERENEAGGLLMYGIPNMKLPKDIVRRRIELMQDEGVTFVLGVNAAEPETAKRLVSDYDAVVLCCGAEKPREFSFVGEGDVFYAADFLKDAIERVSLHKESDFPTAEGRDVVIIGTGDTASDCVATAIRQGAKSVIQLVRRKREDYLDSNGALPMDYAHEEYEAVFGGDARRFGVQVESLVKDENGALSGVVTTDGDTIPCTLLLAATGTVGCEDKVCAAFGVEKEKTVLTKADSYQTSVEKIFTAGDMRRGASLVVWAIAEGRACAAEVDSYLNGYTNLK